MVLAVLGFFSVVILSVNVAFAKDADIGRSRIHPASPLYFLKATKETLQLKFARTGQDRILLQLKFATTRLREAKTLVSENQDLIPSTLERYMASLNSISEKLVQSQPDLNIKEKLDLHLKVLEQMYAKTSNPKAKMAIRSVMNRVIQRADVPSSAKLPLCTLFSKEASSSALNEVERMVFSERAKKCFASLDSDKID